jgi:hypothetical protein
MEKTIYQKLIKAKELRGKTAQYDYSNSNRRFKALNDYVHALSETIRLKCQRDLEINNAKALKNPKKTTIVDNSGARHWYGIGAYNGD